MRKDDVFWDAPFKSHGPTAYLPLHSAAGNHWPASAPSRNISFQLLKNNSFPASRDTSRMLAGLILIPQTRFPKDRRQNCLQTYKIPTSPFLPWPFPLLSKLKDKRTKHIYRKTRQYLTFQATLQQTGFSFHQLQRFCLTKLKSVIICTVEIFPDWGII